MDELPADEKSALSAAWRLQHGGNFVSAFDLAQDALTRWPQSQPLQYVSILALASCGSAKAALTAFRATGLAATAQEDYLALEARLLKDLAFLGGGDAAGTSLSRAAEAYERIAHRTGGSFTALNAAVLWLLAGEAARALGLARQVMAILARSAVSAEPQAAYFHWATMAEAALVLGDRAALESAVVAANPLCRHNVWARTRTLTQLRRLQPLRPQCAAILDRWYRPPIGLVLGASVRLAAVASTACAPLADGDMPALAFATGLEREDDWRSLAAQGVQLHVIVANAPAEQREGAAAQFHANRQASGRRDACTWSSLLLDEGGDDHPACALTALGLSLGHADVLHAPWVVLTRTGGGWRHYPDLARETVEAAMLPPGAADTRTRYGLVFADAVGYSTLNARDTRRYWSTLLPDAAASVLRRHGDSVLFRKTWGDAVHAVFRTATAAAQAALEMTAATATLVEELEFGRRLAFRVAVHFGTADTGLDPIEETATYFGPQLSFAARIVPVAPPGGVFVTEACAAQLSLEGARGMDYTYIGTTSLAKGYGRVRLLTLSSRR